MLAEDLWDVVEATTKPPEQEDDEVEFKAWRKSNAKALHSIQISCGVDTFSFIMGASAAKVAWDILAKELKPAKASQATGTGEISNDHTNNNPKIVEAESENDVIVELPHEASLAGEDNQVNQTITAFVTTGKFYDAMELLKRNPKAVTARILDNGTILHWAIHFKEVDIAKELVHFMRPEDLEIQDHVGDTALHRVITDIPESVELAKCMVEKNKKLLSIVLPSQKTIALLAGKITPLIHAHGRSRGGEKMAQYLYSVTPHETLNNSERAMLIIHGLMLKRFDIAWNLIQRYPESVIAEDFYGRTPLNELAGMRSAFLSGSSLNFWEQWIYDGIQIKPIEEPIPTTGDAVFINVQKSEDGNQSNKRQRHLICSEEHKWGWFVSSKDKSRNNMLHAVGTISSAAQINLIRGAALQMQRELQWFKEVERFAQPVDHEVINKTDEMTPRELFTKGHKDLVKEGEKAMKGTATSCTVVGALIVTIMFAAAFTVPGGNKQDTGLPMFLSQRAFITFIVSDVISLFSSTTSVMIFLGILTSRYAEDDFLKSLPTKMILGLITLFLSIATMMIAFSSALSIILHGKSSIVILVTLLASVPVASFVWMQFPLLLELVISTYGAGVFDSKIKDWLDEEPEYPVSC
ncbi:uncharacterized protein [Pyrus communis]|uniref:uncharacterized protein n=1 Tax=Pyrus communis TaxID=23211 RepID=UPI0035C03D3A